ncbi:hypothetical protein [Streptomyces sp. NPDC051214]|uniref:hypothetical protein n=1 Tax=Streptomyces sp. NPDC051214 TaxID=3155282 RepID=UPI003422FEAE
MDGTVIVGAVAGVLGAAVGAAGAVTASVVAGRQQNQGQHAHWRREVRRTAYAGFLHCAREAQERLSDLATATEAAELQEALLEAIGTTLGEDAPTKKGELFRAVTEAVKETIRHQGIVDLEGPPQVAESSRRVSIALALSLRGAFEHSHPGGIELLWRVMNKAAPESTSDDLPDFPQSYEDQEPYTSLLIAAFTEECRDVLDGGMSN